MIGSVQQPRQHRITRLSADIVRFSWRHAKRSTFLREGDGFCTTEGALSDHLGQLMRELGQSAASVAKIIITTPVAVLTVAAGG